MPRKTKLVKVCRACNKTFETLVSRKVVCNRECHKVWYKQWASEHTIGCKNPFYGKAHSEETKQRMSNKKSELVKKGWKPANYIDGKGTQRKSKLTSDRSWRKTRLRILIRDNNMCQMPLCDKLALEVHHIMPHRCEGQAYDDNLISLCRKCHYNIYGKELEFKDLFLGVVANKKNSYNANGGSLEVDNPVAIKSARD